MKKTLTIALAVALLIPATKATANENLVESICGYVVTDNKSRLRKVLKENKVRLRNIYDSITCDGQSILRFAIANDANAVGGFVSSKLSIKALQAPEEDGLTIVDWATEFGHTGSPVIANIKDKIGG